MDNNLDDILPIEHVTPTSKNSDLKAERTESAFYEIMSVNFLFQCMKLQRYPNLHSCFSKNTLHFRVLYSYEVLQVSLALNYQTPCANLHLVQQGQYPFSTKFLHSQTLSLLDLVLLQSERLMEWSLQQVSNESFWLSGEQSLCLTLDRESKCGLLFQQRALQLFQRYLLRGLALLQCGCQSIEQLRLEYSSISLDYNYGIIFDSN